MSRAAARFTQAELERTLRATEAMRARVVIKIVDGAIAIWPIEACDGDARRGQVAGGKEALEEATPLANQKEYRL